MASYATIKIRIADECQRYLEVAARLREGLENDMFGGLAKGRVGIDPKSMRSWKDAVAAFNSLVDAKIRLDKNAKQMADEMSSEDELVAVRDYVRSLEPTLRGTFLREETEWHENHTVRAGQQSGR